MLVKIVKQKVRQFRLSRAAILDDSEYRAEMVGDWAMCTAGVRNDSVVYSFGVGVSTGWDQEMIRRFGVRVHAFDPTPASIAWVGRQSLSPQFVFHDYGISNFDGMLTFYPPRRRNDPHFSQERRGGLLDRRRGVPGRVFRLETIMRKLCHRKIDVLKLDVEGAEFEAIPDLIASGVCVEQLLIEIHYQFRSRSFRQGIDLIESLKAYGMQCIYVSPRGFEFAFVRPRPMAMRAAA